MFKPKTLAQFVMVGASCAPAIAAITSTGGAVAVLSTPPASVMPDAFQNDTTVWIFEEQMDLVLTDSVLLDVTMPSIVVDDPAELSPRTLPAGYGINCYYIHFDPAMPATVGGFVTFSERILGVIVTDSSLDASNLLLGVSTTAYPPGIGAYGLELPQAPVPDSVSLSADMTTLFITLGAGTPGDRIRVLTERTP